MDLKLEQVIDKKRFSLHGFRKGLIETGSNGSIESGHING